MIENFSLTLHLKNKYKKYARRKSPEISFGRTEEN